MSYGTGTSAYLPAGATDAQGNKAVLTYDGAGNPTSAMNSATAAKASITYHQDGTLATSTDPTGNLTRYGEDVGTHQVTSITPPAGSGLGATSLTWDGYARMASVTDGRGVTTSYAYTDLDEVAAISFSDATATIGYIYNESGQVRTRTDGSGTVTYTYNARDDLISRSASTGGGALGCGYDLAGNLTSSTTGRGTTAYTYDDANQLTSLTPPGGALTRYAYNSDGKRSDTWWKTNIEHTSFAAHTHTDFDAAGRVGRTWTSRNSVETTRVFDTSYCYLASTVGAPCPTSTNSTNRSTGLIRWSLGQPHRGPVELHLRRGEPPDQGQQLRRAQLRLRL